MPAAQVIATFLLEDDGAPARIAKLGGGGEAGQPAPDDDRIHPFHHRSPPQTSLAKLSQEDCARQRESTFGAVNRVTSRQRHFAGSRCQSRADIRRLAVADLFACLTRGNDNYRTVAPPAREFRAKGLQIRRKP